MRFLTQIHNYIATGFIFLFLYLLSLVPAQFEVLDPIGKAIGDFELTDLVFSQLQGEKNPDTNIVLVNIKDLSRGDIGKQIQMLSEHNPAVIGIDAFFRSKKEFSDDIQLIMALANAPNVVMVSELVNANEDDCFDSIATSHSQFNQFVENGFANMVTAAVGHKTTREFAPKYCYKDSSELSFGMKLASYINPEAVELAKKRDNDIEIINWRGNYEKFYHLDAEDVLNGETDLSFIENKIVILGFMGLRYLGEESLEDTFFTPMNKNTGSKSVPDMYGVVVHANIISMILNNDFINDIPHWVDYVLAVLLVFLNVSLFMWVGTYYKLYYDLISKTIQLVEVVLLFGVNLMSMLYFQLKVDLTLAIIAIVFCGDLTELYAGSLRGISENIYAKLTSKKK